MPSNQKPMRNRTTGLSILEVMVALAIMAMVIGLAGPRLIDGLGRAKSQAAEIEIANIKAAIQMYYIDTGRYPSEAEGLSSLVRQPAEVANWNGPYLDGNEAMLDPWGRQYFYHFPGTDRAFDLFTYGRDGQPGGSAEDKDIRL